MIGPSTRLVVLLATACTAGEAAARPPAVSPQLRTRLNGEGMAARLRYQTYIRTLTGTVKSRTKHNLIQPKGKPVPTQMTETKLTIKRHGEWAYFQYESGRGGGQADGKVFAVNSRYGFVATREAGKPDWVLASLFHGPKPPAQHHRADDSDTLAQHADGTLLWSLHVGLAKPLPDLLRDPKFQIVGLRTLTAPRPGLVELAFSFSGGSYKSATGSAVLDPDCEWGVVEFHTASEWVGRNNVTNARTTTRRGDLVKSGGSLLPVRATTTSEGRPGDLPGVVDRSESETEYALRPAPDLPEAEFTLAAVGLPESVAAPSPESELAPASLTAERVGRNLWLVLLGFGVTAVAAALVLARRRQART